MNNRSGLWLLAVAALAFGMTGCTSESYSPAIVYTVRTDPLVLTDKLGKPELDEPDRPGILPLLSAKDLLDPRSPMFEKGESLFATKDLLDPTWLSKEHRDFIRQFLDKTFGTPREPWVGQIESNKREVIGLQEEAMKRGSALYRVHCIHCHGLAGDGRGPTARWVNPHPRDFRRGLFKFASVDQSGGARPPRRDDLVRTIHNGIEGTAMPSFALLPRQDIEDLASYVIHLSIRGNVEYETIRNAFDVDTTMRLLTLREGEDLGERMFGLFTVTVNAWYEAQRADQAIKVEPYPYTDWVETGGQKKMHKELKDSILRGHQLFIGVGADKATDVMPTKEEAKAANCISCHTDYGRQAKFKFDSWGTLVKARNLTEGLYRGGRNPEDIYRRIHSGISGSGMTPFGKTLTNPGRIWDLVNFVRTLPYPAMRQEVGISIN